MFKAWSSVSTHDSSSSTLSENCCRCQFLTDDYVHVAYGVPPTFVEALVSQHCFTVYAAKVGNATLNCAEQKLRPKCDESALLLKKKEHREICFQV